MHLQLGILATYGLEYAKLIFLAKLVQCVTQVLGQAHNGVSFGLPYQLTLKREGPLCVNFAISLLTKYWVRNYNCCRYINSKWVLTASFAACLFHLSIGICSLLLTTCAIYKCHQKEASRTRSRKMGKVDGLTDHFRAGINLVKKVVC